MRYGAFSSSVDPNKLAATVSGALKVIASFAVISGVAGMGADLTTIGDNVVQLGAQATEIIAIGTAAWGVVESTYGICRKIAVAIGQRFHGGN
jgi:hypothetical protein